jgi:hypothetical protein
MFLKTVKTSEVLRNKKWCKWLRRQNVSDGLIFYTLKRDVRSTIPDSVKVKDYSIYLCKQYFIT